MKETLIIHSWGSVDPNTFHMQIILAIEEKMWKEPGKEQMAKPWAAVGRLATWWS